MTRVLVCGGRHYNDMGCVWGKLDALHALSGPVEVVIQGGSSGTDRLAASWAHHNSVPVEQYAADWLSHGRAAGPRRNKRMLIDGKPDLVLAFPGGRGTADMIRQARDAGVVVEIVA